MTEKLFGSFMMGANNLGNGDTISILNLSSPSRSQIGFEHITDVVDLEIVDFSSRFIDILLVVVI